MADQSKVSAEKIKKIVDELIHNSNPSVATMKQVTDEIDNQNEKLDSTRIVFEKLNEEINTVNAIIESVSDDIRILDIRKNDVGNAIDNLAAISEENEAGTKETSSSMAALSDVVNDCREVTEQFVKLSEDLTNNTSRFKL